MTHSLGARATSLAASAAILGLAVFGAFSVSITLGASPFDDAPIIDAGLLPEPPPEPPPPIVHPQTPPPPTTTSEPEETTLISDPLPPRMVDAGPPQTWTGPPGPQVITNPRWLRQPRDLARYYPSRALARSITGQVVLDCLVDTNGVLNCSVVSETPANWGFGDAARRIASDYRMVPAMQDGQAVEGRYRMRVPFEVH